MTVAFDIRPPAPPPAPSPGKAHSELARAEVRRALAAMLRRRVPGQEVDDLAQTILCDALASGTIPTDPEEIRRWLGGIARHKIADYHRRAARRGAREAVWGTDGEAPLASCAAPPSAFEEREVLHRLLGAIESRRDAETMEWLVREHGGERLADIAAENGLPAPVVRQRVSRLRRALRSRWASAVGVLVLVLGVAAAFGWSRAHLDDAPSPAVTPIVPEQIVPPPQKPVPAPSPTLDSLQGNWVMASIRPDRELTATEQKFVDKWSRLAMLDVHQSNVTLRTNAWSESWHVAATTTVEGTTAHLHLESPHGPAEDVDIVVRKETSGTYVDLSLPGHPKYPGKLTLKRPIR